MDLSYRSCILSQLSTVMFMIIGMHNIIGSFPIMFPIRAIVMIMIIRMHTLDPSQFGFKKRFNRKCLLAPGMLISSHFVVTKAESIGSALNYEF